MSTTDALKFLISRLTRPLIGLDVGARWGAPLPWKQLGDRLIAIGFDADATECERLNASATDGMTFIHAMLADTEGERDFHIGDEPATSSIFPPVAALVQRYPALASMRTNRSIRLPTKRLDDAIQGHLERADILKLDTQGSELRILRGATSILRSVSLVDIEVCFNPLYSGQDLFCDVDRFLRGNGFALWRLGNLVHYAPQSEPAAFSEISVHSDPAPYERVRAPNGQLFWSEAVYVRDTFPATSDEEFGEREGLEAATVSALYGLWDLALEILSRTSDGNVYRETQSLVRSAS